MLSAMLSSMDESPNLLGKTGEKSKRVSLAEPEETLD